MSSAKRSAATSAAAADSPVSGGGRKRLLAIAGQCFAHNGYAGTSIDQVSKAAGVTKGAIYYHFKDKEDLLAAVVADRVAAFEDSVQRSIEDAQPPAALRRIGDVCCSNTRAGDHTRFTIKLMVESIDSMPQVCHQLNEMMKKFRAFLRNIIRLGQSEGVFADRADADVCAATFTSGVLGAQIQFYQDEERFDLEATIQLIVEQLLTALAVGTGAEPNPA